MRITMNKKEAIKYLKQLYPNGGHCWLDDQRMEAVGMAIQALQEEPVSEEQVKEDTMTIRKEWFDHCKKSWYNEGYIDGEYNRDRQFENSVSNDLREASFALAKKELINPKFPSDRKYELAYMFEEGAKWEADQFEKERLKQCDTLTKEQAKIESDFVVNFIKKNNCTPTFIDAIEYGMKMQKEKMMAKAINAECFGFHQGAALFSVKLPAGNYLVGSEVKVIVIKDE